MPEAAVRGVRQAQAEDVTIVDLDQLEKVLPQLVRGAQVGSLQHQVVPSSSL
jgi:hypothetical protein